MKSRAFDIIASSLGGVELDGYGRECERWACSETIVKSPSSRTEYLRGGNCVGSVAPALLETFARYEMGLSREIAIIEIAVESHDSW